MLCLLLIQFVSAQKNTTLPLKNSCESKKSSSLNTLTLTFHTESNLFTSEKEQSFFQEEKTMSRWIDRAREIQKFHVSKLRENDAWRIQDTADSLKYSIGAVSQYLTIASWLKTHENQLQRFSSAKEAIAFIKDKKQQLLLED